MEMIYLDNNATTRVAPEVIAAMLPHFTETYGNMSSRHAAGMAAMAAARAARKAVASLTGAGEAEIVFTSGGTESNGTALLSALDVQPARREIIVSAVEHSSVLKVAEHLAKIGRAVLHVLPVDADGRIDLAELARLLTPRTALLSLQLANSETGVLQPVAEAAALAKSVGALVHCDAVQALAKMPLDLAGLGVDMASISAHKIGGPKGIGALYLRKGVPFRSQVLGGAQERGRRAGTENVPGIVGFGAACQLAAARMADLPEIARRRDRLEAGLLAAIPGTLVAGGGAPRIGNTTFLLFEGLDSDAILTLLDRAGICASAGSACAAGSMEPSHVLKAMGVPASHIKGAVRLSLSSETSDADVDRVLATLPGIVAHLRSDARAVA